MREHAGLSVWRCSGCGRMDSLPVSHCPGCSGAAIEAQRVPARGLLKSWTIVRRPPPKFSALGAYAVGIIDLEAGLRVLGRLSVDPSALRLDLPVTLADVVDAAPIFTRMEDA